MAGRTAAGHPGPLAHRPPPQPPPARPARPLRAVVAHPPPEVRCPRRPGVPRRPAWLCPAARPLPSPTSCCPLLLVLAVTALARPGRRGEQLRIVVAHNTLTACRRTGPSARTALLWHFPLITTSAAAAGGSASVAAAAAEPPPAATCGGEGSCSGSAATSTVRLAPQRDPRAGERFRLGRWGSGEQCPAPLPARASKCKVRARATAALSFCNSLFPTPQRYDAGGARDTWAGRLQESHCCSAAIYPSDLCHPLPCLQQRAPGQQLRRHFIGLPAASSSPNVTQARRRASAASPAPPGQHLPRENGGGVRCTAGWGAVGRGQGRARRAYSSRQACRYVLLPTPTQLKSQEGSFTRLPPLPLSSVDPLLSPRYVVLIKNNMNLSPPE